MAKENLSLNLGKILKSITMNRIFLVLFSLLFSLSVAAQDKIAQFKQYVEQSFQQWDIPSVAVAVVQDGKIVFAQAYGYTSWDKTAKVNANTLYPIGSVSKSFTALAMAQLVEQGKLSWDTKVIDIVPEFRLYNDYVTANTTVEDLLCHRVGLATFSGDLLWYRTSYSVDQIIPRLRYLNPSFDFRNGFGYSNVMFMVAGKVIENISGQDYATYIRQHILNPLDMRRTTLDIDQMKQQGNYAIGCYTTAQGEKKTISYIPSHNIQAFGGINSSVNDLANYMIMLMNDGEFDGKQIIPAKQIRYLWQMHNPMGVSAKDKQLHPSRHFYGYGLGWFVYDQNGYKIVTHSGGMDGALCRLLMIPEKKLGVVVLTNSSNFLYNALTEYFADLFTSDNPPFDWNKYYLDLYKRYINSYVAMKQRHKQIPGTQPPPLDRYTGTYHSQMYGDIIVEQNRGHLQLNFKPAPYLDADLSHWHYNTFEIHFRNPLMAIPTQWGLAQFIPDPDGNITKLKLIVPNYDFLFNELELKKIR